MASVLRLGERGVVLHVGAERSAMVPCGSLSLLALIMQKDCR